MSAASVDWIPPSKAVATRTAARRAVLLTMIVCMTACTPYSGDGQLVDRGWMRYPSRYLLDLGPVDLTQAERTCFSLAGLPRAEFVAGIDIVEGEGLTISGPTPDYAVSAHLKLTTESGETVIDEAAPLSAWTRQTPADAPLGGRLYLRGESAQHPLPDGGSRGERIGTRAHGGWGSYFKPERNVRYRMCFSVVFTELAQPIPARLSLVGW